LKVKKKLGRFILTRLDGRVWVGLIWLRVGQMTGCCEHGNPCLCFVLSLQCTTVQFPQFQAAVTQIIICFFSTIFYNQFFLICRLKYGLVIVLFKVKLMYPLMMDLQGPKSVLV
jgi:hypothetical protein